VRYAHELASILNNFARPLDPSRATAKSRPEPSVESSGTSPNAASGDTSRMSKVFAPDWSRINLNRALGVLAVMAIPLGVSIATGQEKYWLSASFGALFVGLSDQGGDFAKRVARMGIVGVIGAVLTLLGFGIGTHGWGLVALASFMVTLVAGLAVKFGVHRFVSAYLLNVWFIICVGLPGTYALEGVRTHAERQALAWLAGSALWIAAAGVLWLVRGRGSQPSPFQEIPADTAPRELTGPVIMFAVIRALAVSLAIAIAFGLELPNAYWMPIATLVAMKASLEQSALEAEQRLAGATVGAIFATLVPAHRRRQARARSDHRSSRGARGRDQDSQLRALFGEHRGSCSHR
jgi:hypothetical protein